MTHNAVNPAQLINAAQQSATLPHHANMDTEMALGEQVHVNESSYNRQGVNYVAHQPSNDPMTIDKFQELAKDQSALSPASKVRAVSKML